MEDAPDLSISHRSTKDVGNSFWVPPSSDLTNLPTGDMRDSVRSLLDDVLEYDDGRLAELSEHVAPYLE